MIAIPLFLPKDDIQLGGLLVSAPEPGQHSTVWLADFLYQQHRKDLAVSSFVIVRQPVDQIMQEYYFKKEILPTLRQRITSLPIYLLGSQNFDHFLSDNLNPAANDVLSDFTRMSIIDQIRQIELEWYAIHSNALLRSSDNRYFRAPSSRYCQNFLRVGNIQTTRQAVDAIFFWLLPWLKNCSAIIAESWTISSTAFNAARLLGRYDPREHSRCKVDMLSSYHDSEAIGQETEDIIKRVIPKDERKILLLVSSSMSGNLVLQFKNTVNRLGIPSEKCSYGTIYSLNKTQPVPALCDATRLVAADGFSYLDRLPAGATAIEIDSHTYFPLRMEEATANFRKQAADLFKPFFEAYRTTDLFSVHRNCTDLYGQVLRHHAIHLDIEAILTTEPFKSDYDRLLDEIEPIPKAIVVPPHRTGQRMAEIAQTKLQERGSTSIRVIMHPDLAFNSAEAPPPDIAYLKTLAAADSILIMDDVSISGRRMSTYAQSLRTLGYQGQIHFRVGIARPKEKRAWDRMSSQLRHRGTIQPPNTVSQVHIVVLPDWDKEQCPWCAEQSFYRCHVSSLDSIPAALVERMQSLVHDEHSIPMIDNIFVNTSTEEPITLAQGSIFLSNPSKQAALFCAVASTLQSMRVCEAKPYMPPLNYPEVTVIDPINYLGDRFPETSIRAAIIRASLVSELTRTKDADEIERGNMVRAVLFGGNQSKNLSLEILTGMHLRKLPKMMFSENETEELRARYPDFSLLFS